MIDFVAGALAMGYFVAGLFFLRFWRDTTERLFAYFAVAFWLLAAQRVALVLLSHQTPDELVWLYAIRLAAFLLILGGILDKNRAASRATQNRG